MGSTSLHREKGLTDRQFFEQEFPNALTRSGRILDCATLATTGGWQRVFYAAVKGSQATGPDTVWCLVVLMHWQRGHYNFTYKDMDDTMGPSEDECPARILDLLTPTDSDWSNQWRARCRDNAERLSRSRALPQGSFIRFERAYEFSNDYEVTRFLLAEKGRQPVWRALCDDGYSFACRLPRDWWRRNWTVARTPSAVPA
jgi:hypothetical protein